MKNRIILVLLYIVINTNFLYTQTANNLAEFDGKSFSTEQFSKQFELSPMVFNTADTEQKKEIFLLSMTSEKLWSTKAENLDPLANPLIKYSLAEIKKKLVRDVLYKVEIQNKINYTTEELNTAVQRYKQSVDLIIFTSQKKENIQDVHKRLSTGTPPDSIRYFVKDVYSENIKVAYGDMLEDYENIVYNLTPGKFSKPLETEAGQTVFYVKNREINPENVSKESEAVISSARKVLEKHKIKALYTEFNKNFLGGRQINADIELFNKLSEKIAKLGQSRIVDDTSGFTLSFHEIYGLANTFPESEKKSPFIKFSNKPVSLEDFLGSLGFEGIKLPDANIKSVKAFLSGWIRNYIRMELLARESFNRGYDKYPEVTEELQMWKDNYYATYAMREFTDKIEIGEAEIEKYVSGVRGDGYTAYFYKITGIRTTSIEKINIILEESDQGKEFGETVSRIKSGGDEILDYNYVTLNETGLLAEYIPKLNKGEIYGPVEENGSYIIFRLDDKKESEKDINSEMFRNEARSRLYNEKLEKLIEEETIKLAEKYNLKVNTNALESVRVNDINIVVMRSFGFGEKMLAAPMIQRNYKWYRKWQKEKEEL